MNYRLTGKMSIDFDTQVIGTMEDVEALMQKFKEVSILMDDLNLTTHSSVHTARVTSHSFKWLTVEDENEEIVEVDNEA